MVFVFFVGRAGKTEPSAHLFFVNFSSFFSDGFLPSVLTEGGFWLVFMFGREKEKGKPQRNFNSHVVPHFYHIYISGHIYKFLR